MTTPRDPRSPDFDSICTCKCGSCLLRDHKNCINPAHVAAFNASVDWEDDLRRTRGSRGTP